MEGLKLWGYSCGGWGANRGAGGQVVERLKLWGCSYGDRGGQAEEGEAGEGRGLGCCKGPGQHRATQLVNNN